MSTTDPLSYTVVSDDGRSESPSTQELRTALEKGSDEVKLETLRTIVVATLNGNPQVSQTHLRCIYLLMKIRGGGVCEEDNGRPRVHLSQRGSETHSTKELTSCFPLCVMYDSPTFSCPSSNTSFRIETSRSRRCSPSTGSQSSQHCSSRSPFHALARNRSNPLKLTSLTCRASCSVVFASLRVCPKLDENGKLKQEMILVW